jgi:5-methylthioadenosine/S-adenosylhomocysteine deaminase
LHCYGSSIFCNLDFIWYYYRPAPNTRHERFDDRRADKKHQQPRRDVGYVPVHAHGVPTGGEWWSFSELDHPEDVRRIRDTYFSSDDQLLTLALAARAPGNSNFEVAKHDWALARELGIRISVHVGMRLTGVHVHHVKNMDDLGLLGPDTTYIHCTDSTDEELDLIASTGGTTSVAPYVEMLMGHGPPPTGRLLERGVRPSLSVDVVSSVPGEMFTQMRTALIQDRIRSFPATPDTAFEPTLTHRDVLEFATIGGARACALDDHVGSLTPGKQADIVLLKTDAINTAPLLDPVGTIVVSADTSNVDSVLVAGRAVKRGGQLLDTDMNSVVAKLEASRNHILSGGVRLPEWAAPEATAPA